MLLAVDTATRSASVALFDATGLLAENNWRSRNNHSVEVMPAIHAMLSQQGVDVTSLQAVAVAEGPGSFTGLRIGMSIAKGLCFALDVPILAVPTLQISAYATGDPGCPIYAVLEAGRGRISVGAYRFREGIPALQGEIALVSEAQWVVPAEENALVVGELNSALVERLRQQPGAERIGFLPVASSLRRAGYLAELAWKRLQRGDVDEVDSLSPVYTSLPSSQPSV